jgi:hypothetical protein
LLEFIRSLKLVVKDMVEDKEAAKDDEDHYFNLSNIP